MKQKEFRGGRILKRRREFRGGRESWDRLSVTLPVVNKGKIRYGTVFGQSEGAAAFMRPSANLSNLSQFIYPGFISRFYISVFIPVFISVCGILF